MMVKEVVSSVAITKFTRRNRLSDSCLVSFFFFHRFNVTLGNRCLSGRLIISLPLFARLFSCLLVWRPARQTNPTSGLWLLERLKAVSRFAQRARNRDLGA